MELLRNLDDWEKWRNNHFDKDIYLRPSEYPCYTYTKVTSWSMQMEMPKYLYLEDLENMLREMADE